MNNNLNKCSQRTKKEGSVFEGSSGHSSKKTIWNKHKHPLHKISYPDVIIKASPLSKKSATLIFAPSSLYKSSIASISLSRETRVRSSDSVSTVFRISNKNRLVITSSAITWCPRLLVGILEGRPVTTSPVKSAPFRRVDVVFAEPQHSEFQPNRAPFFARIRVREKCTKGGRLLMIFRTNDQWRA